MLRKNTIVVICVLAGSAVAVAAVALQGCARDTAKSMLLQVGGPSVYSDIKAASGKKNDGRAIGMMTLPPEGASATGIVDKYGQYTNADWPGKIHTDADLAKQLDIERKDLAANPGPTDRDDYGGWTKGPQLKSTGFFRTEKVDGKWWLVTPAGHVFFSIGVDTVTDASPTFISGREQLFSSLPNHSDALGRHYDTAHAFDRATKNDGETFDFYRANLDRKYGTDFDTTWSNTALTRMKSWGFNTLGNWSDPRVYSLHKLPYTTSIGISGDFHRVSNGANTWGKMPDPFDPKFATAVRSRVAILAGRIKNDPWCIGCFVDNELSWPHNDKSSQYSLAVGTLSEDTDASPAKQALIDSLKKQYISVDKLNESWDTNFESWDALNPPYQLAAELTSAQASDLSAFVEQYAEQYFRLVSEALKAADPDHLYLGCRIAIHRDERPLPEIFEAAQKYCDVISFNFYNGGISTDQFGLFQKLSKPLLVGEFDSVATDHGNFWEGVFDAETQDQRAHYYTQYVTDAATNPSIVGCHWYQYFDEPVTGRTFDGENGDVGLVDVADTPYHQLIDAARDENGRIYQIRSGS